MSNDPFAPLDINFEPLDINFEPLAFDGPDLTWPPRDDVERARDDMTTARWLYRTAWLRWRIAVAMATPDQRAAFDDLFADLAKFGATDD
jgi:hypothetical protein